MSPSARATVIGGLSPSSAYTLSIVAVNAVGAATAVATATTPAQPITNPTAPRNIVATPGDGFLIFTWDEPASWGGSTLSVYQLFFGPVGQAFTPYGTPTVASLSVGSLTNGNQYRFRVRARSQANKNGPYAPIVTAIPAAPATAPSAPRNLSGTPLPASFRLSWSAPLNDGGASVTAYIIYVSPDAVLTVSGDVLTATVTGLTPGVALVFWVRARNSAGDSGNSNFASGSPLPLPATQPSTAAQHCGGYGQPFVCYQLGRARRLGQLHAFHLSHGLGATDNDNTHIVETADNRVTLSTHLDPNGGSNQCAFGCGQQLLHAHWRALASQLGQQLHSLPRFRLFSRHRRCRAAARRHRALCAFCFCRRRAGDCNGGNRAGYPQLERARQRRRAAHRLHFELWRGVNKLACKPNGDGCWR